MDIGCSHVAGLYQSAKHSLDAFPLDVKVTNALQFLQTIGLTKNFSPLVLICGHGGETENNPYQASLDCGACGGNAGFVNAIVVCQILNDPVVREGLRFHNIDITDTSYFIAGFHNTTRDAVTLYEHDINDLQRKKVYQLKNDLKLASDFLRQERLSELPGNFSTVDRSTNWAELIPEMGLINNAALIIGPREITKNISLQRRVFLHSYDPSIDGDGLLLKGIFLGPVIVAHWINAQYYFSSTDPCIYGSGNKMLHNVIPGLGVIEGNLSDLKIGLPWQSVAFSNQLVHQPLRLLVIIYAPRNRVESVLAECPTIKSLCDGEWVHLKIIEPGE